jgi:trimeric autotransporter adhesin
MPISSTNPGGAVPPDMRKQRLTLSALEIGEVISGVFTSAGSPGTAFSYTIASTNVTTATAGLETAIDAKAAAGTGTAWAEVAVTNGTTYLDVFSLDADGDLVFSSTPPEAPTVTTKIWTGNSVARAQVTTLTPLNVLTGDTFSVRINGKTISVVATADTAANVATLLAAAINASQIAEWKEVTATASGDVVTLTARTAGVPFVVTAGSSDAVGLEITTLITGSAGTDARQEFAIPKSAAGTFKITFGDQITSAIAVGATTSAVQTALQALSTIGSGNCSVGGGDSADGNDDRYWVTFTGTLAKTPVAQLIVDLQSTKPLIRTTQQGGHSGTVRNERQTIEVGQTRSFTLTLDGQTTSTITTTLATADDSGLFSSAIGSLSNVESVLVTKLSQDNLNGTATYQIEWTDYDGSAAQTQLTASVYGASSSQVHRLTITNTAGVVAVNEVQKVAIQGTASGGTFTLTYAGQTTSAIAYNASTSTVAAALEALSNIGSGDVSVTGSAGSWSVAFTGALAGGDRAQMTATSSLTGTAAANVTAATITSSAGPNHWDTADNWLPVGVPTNGDAVRFEIGNVDCLYGLDQTGITLASAWFSMGWTGQLGLPRVNQSGYLEYRTRELTCGITDLTVGQSSGSGPRKVAVNTLTVATSITVIDSGGSSETGVPTVIWRGTHADNVIEVQGGDFGSAWWSDESAQISSLVQTDGTVFLKHTAIEDSIDCSDQDVRAFQCTLGGKPFNI